MRHIIESTSTAVETPRGRLVEFTGPSIRTDAVYVVFTSIEETLAAVRVAGDFARALGVPVTLVHFRPVPYALPVDQPCGISPVETEAFIARLRVECLDVRVRVWSCRDERRAMRLAFKGHSLIVIAGRRRWWPTRSGRLRRMLEEAGHYVVFADTSEPSLRGRHDACAAPPVLKKETAHA